MFIKYISYLKKEEKDTYTFAADTYTYQNFYRYHVRYTSRILYKYFSTYGRL